MAITDVDVTAHPRRKTGIGRLDHLLGGGFVPGSSVLLVGAPGAGKSTLVLQLLKKMNIRSLFVSGEESLQQLKLRADRLRVNSPKLFLLFETNVNRIIPHVERLRPGVLVIDSIQTMYNNFSDSMPVGPSQIRKCCHILRRAAQQKDFILILVGQATKGKKSAGPNLLEHAVDVVLYLDLEAGPKQPRLLHAAKNRFGSTVTRCVLQMGKSGLAFLPSGRGGRDEGT